MSLGANESHKSWMMTDMHALLSDIQTMGNNNHLSLLILYTLHNKISIYNAFILDFRIFTFEKNGYWPSNTIIVVVDIVVIGG